MCAEMAAEMGKGRFYPDLGERMTQFELTLLDINNSVSAQLWEETPRTGPCRSARRPLRRGGGSASG